jgi:hypothetical protein
MPVVLCGCETWCLALTGEHRLRVFENRVLRRIFVSKRDEVKYGIGGKCIMKSFLICKSFGYFFELIIPPPKWPWGRLSLY